MRAGQPQDLSLGSDGDNLSQMKLAQIGHGSLRRLLEEIPSIGIRLNWCACVACVRACVQSVCAGMRVCMRTDLA